MNSRDAAARLAYVEGLRTATRRAVLLPSFTIAIVLGAVIATHGVVAGLWPDSRAASLVWLVGVLAARPLLRRPASLQSARLPLVCAATGVAAALVAGAVGLNPLVSGLAVLIALRAQLAGLPVVALAALATGAMADAVLLDAPPGGVEIALGAGLAVLGLAGRAWERR